MLENDASVVVDLTSIIKDLSAHLKTINLVFTEKLRWKNNLVRDLSGSALQLSSTSRDTTLC